MNMMTWLSSEFKLTSYYVSCISGCGYSSAVETAAWLVQFDGGLGRKVGGGQKWTAILYSSQLCEVQINLTLQVCVT